MASNINPFAGLPPYMGVSPDGMVAIVIPNTGLKDAEVYLDDEGPFPVKPIVAQALAARWADPSSANMLIAIGALPPQPSKRKELARRRVTFRGTVGSVSSGPGGGQVILDNQSVWDLAMEYYSPVGVLRAIGGTVQMAADAYSSLATRTIDAWGANVRGVWVEIRAALKEAEGLAEKGGDLVERGAKGFGTGASFGTVMGITISGVILWFMFGGGAASTAASAAAAYKSFKQ